MSEEADIPELQEGIEEESDIFEFGEKQKRSGQQCRTDISLFISEVERYGISDRAASALYNAALMCNNIITKECKDKVVDKYKIRRSRESFRALQSLKKQNEIEDQGGLGCIGVDGKRDRKSKKVMTYAVDGVAFEKKVVDSP